MKVKFGFSTQFCGCAEKEVEIPDNSTDKDIEAMFPEVIGIEYDENCYFKRL